jgi:hypothetical protein
VHLRYFLRKFNNSGRNGEEAPRRDVPNGDTH